MKKPSEWINTIIEDLVDPNMQLKNVLLKVQVLAHQLKDDKFSTWVNCEINGYNQNDVPEYRLVKANVMGNLLNHAGFRTAWRKDIFLPTDHLDETTQAELRFMKLDGPIGELEELEKETENLIILPLSSYYKRKINKVLTNGWTCDSARLVINPDSVSGVINSIRSHLLNFLLLINDQIGGDDNFSIMKNKKAIENLFDKTIGKISGENININFGENSVQFTNTGKRAQLNIASGDSTTQNIAALHDEIKEVIQALNTNLHNLNLSKEAVDDIKLEIARIETNLAKENPKYPIIQNAIDIVYQILLEATTSVYSPIILGKVEQLLNNFKF